jgi:hypothetical protein
MNKEEILREIKRTAEANGGTPLGMKKFCVETGIRISDWQCKHWARWGDAIREAGLVANRFRAEACDESELLEKYAQLAREMGRLPTVDDIRLRRRNDSAFPCAEVFHRRWKKPALVAKLPEFCRSHDAYNDVARLCEEYVPGRPETAQESVAPDNNVGYVYLIKSGRFYKIGKANHAGRRSYELAIQLPEKAKEVHVIRTDDPGGIEAYWHNRFATKTEERRMVRPRRHGCRGIQTTEIHVTRKL